MSTIANCLEVVRPFPKKAIACSFAPGFAETLIQIWAADCALNNPGSYYRDQMGNRGICVRALVSGKRSHLRPRYEVQFLDAL